MSQSKWNHFNSFPKSQVLNIFLLGKKELPKLEFSHWCGRKNVVEDRNSMSYPSSAAH